MSKLILIFDTETNGLPNDWKVPASDTDNWPRITQLAFCVYKENGDTVFSFNSLIKPDGWEIPDDYFFIKNEMYTERCEREGMPIKEAIDLFIEWRKKVDVVVAHNIRFDSTILRAEMFRLGDNTEFNSLKICTMAKSVGICKIPSPSGRGYKWPTLSELHNHLFGCDFDGAHDAMNDVIACAKCFFEMVKRGVISLESSSVCKKVDEFKDL